MYHRGTIGKAFGAVFLLIQTLSLVSGISFLTVGTTIYAKIYKLLQISPRNLILPYTLGLFEIISASFGYISLLSRRRTKLFIYISVTLVLMNIQAAVAVKSYIIYEKSGKLMSKEWGSLSEDQRIFIQSRLGCCGVSGLKTEKLSCSSNLDDCMPIIQELAKKIMIYTQRVLIFSFLVESIGIGILSMLKLRRYAPLPSNSVFLCYNEQKSF